MAIPFKAYDVRGIYPEEINEALMENIGKAFANFIKGDTIAVGHDARISSPSLHEAFIKGVISQGKDVIDFGLTSTPMSYFASTFLKTSGTAMITASHNPKEYNGVKFCLSNALPVSGSTGLKEIEQKARSDNFNDSDKLGVVKKINITADYKNSLLKRIKPSNKKLKVVVDPANGMGSQDYQLVEKNLPVNTIPLYFEIDGSYPNHDANPMKEGATDALKKKVVEEKADLGIAFDGDADRVFFVDEKGELISSDLVTALISEEILSKHKGTILYDLRSSNSVPELIQKLGGSAKECRVGHTFIKQMMIDNNAVFAGELSGHLYFKFDSAVYDSGIVGAIELINYLIERQKPLSELIAPLKKYFHTLEINSEVNDKDAKLNELEEKYSDGKVSKLDGLKVTFKDWWFNVRPSNTEPYLRLNLEADTKELMEEKTKELLNLIRK